MNDLAVIITASMSLRHIGFESKIYEMDIESKRMYVLTLFTKPNVVTFANSSNFRQFLPIFARYPLMRRFPKVLFVTFYPELIQFPREHLTAQVFKALNKDPRIHLKMS